VFLNASQVDALLIDETSMLDLPLAAALLDSLPRDRPCQLVLVGTLGSVVIGIRAPV
jgi:AAA domain